MTLFMPADIARESQDWFNRKNFYLVSNRQIEDNCIKKELLSELHGFETIAPLYQYLYKVAAYKMSNKRGH